VRVCLLRAASAAFFLQRKNDASRDMPWCKQVLISAAGLTIINIADLPPSVGSLTPAQGSASGGILMARNTRWTTLFTAN